MKKNHQNLNAVDSSSHRPLLVALAAASSVAFPLYAATVENIVAPGSPFVVTALNATGEVGGYYFQSEFSQHAFISRNGVATDLDTLGGGFSLASGLNASGTLVGFSALVSEVEFHAFQYSAAGLNDLGTLGGSFSAAAAVSDAGHVTGDSNLASDESSFHAFLIPPGGSMIDLGTLGGSSSSAYAVNNSGWVVGSSAVAGNGSLHAFLHNGQSMVDLGTLGGDSSIAIDINDAGQVAGDATTASGETRAFLYTGGTMANLGTLGGTYSSAVALNENGVVVGNSTTANDAETRAFVFQNGSMMDAGSLGGGISRASAINALGQVVGESVDGNSQPRPFLWQNGVMADLNTFLPADSGWELTSARFINDRQQVVGEGLYQGQMTWYLLSLDDEQSINHPPVANAGSDQNLMCGGATRLDSSGSSDPDGDAISFAWLRDGGVIANTAVVELDLPQGAHTFTLRVTDPAGESAEDTVVVTVTTDSLPPVVTCPEPATAPANHRGRAVVPDFLSSLVAQDNCTDAAALVKMQTPVPGTVLKYGTHGVTVTVADASGNVTTCSTLFTVEDVTSPVVRYPEEVFRRARNECQAVVPDLTSRVSANDNCTPAGQLSFTQVPAPGTVVGVGTHPVQITVTDLAGNATVCEIKFIVADVVAPCVKSVSADPRIITPVDGRMVPVTITVEARDNCDANPSARILSVLSSQPATGSNDATTPDWVVTGDLTLDVRAENSANRAPRVYFVLVGVSDASGNTTYRMVSIRVPKN